MHSFMATAANKPDAGILYNETSAGVAWHAFGDFLVETFAWHAAALRGHLAVPHPAEVVVAVIGHRR